jgi:DNA (cytosine-5)-methyltransferase 3A
MRVLSMFDGISCGRVALDRLGIEPEVYYASEIDKYAEASLRGQLPRHYSPRRPFGVEEWNLGPIDLLLGGSSLHSLEYSAKEQQGNRVERDRMGAFSPYM